MPNAGDRTERICFVLLSGIGDVVHGLPIVNALKRDGPGRHITWVVQSEAAPLLAQHPAVDRICTFDRRGGLPELRALWKRLRPHPFDLVLNLNIYLKSAVPTLLARAPRKVSFGRDRARDLVWLFANEHLPAEVSLHTQDKFLEFLIYLGVPAAPLEWGITLTGKEREAQRRFFAPHAGRLVVGLVVTAGRPEKDWPCERFARLATWLVRDLGAHVLLLGGPNRRETTRALAVQQESDCGAEWALGPDLRRLICLVAGCDLVIAPDTGPLHIARALGTPVIGLFGHTDPRRVGPYRAYADLVVDRYNFDGPSQPTTLRGSGGREGRMPLVAVADVTEKVELARRHYLARKKVGVGGRAP